MDNRKDNSCTTIRVTRKFAAYIEKVRVEKKRSTANQLEVMAEKYLPDYPALEEKKK